MRICGPRHGLCSPFGGLWGKPASRRHPSRCFFVEHKERPMPRYTLEAIIVVLLLLWLFGFLIVPIGGSLIHLLLVIILVVVLVRVLQGRSPLP